MKPSLVAVTIAVSASSFAHADVPAKAPVAPPGIYDAQVMDLADAKWAAPKAPEIPAGAMVATIAGDGKTGPSMGYAKLPAGFVFPTHWHSATEYTVVLSGKARFTVDGKSRDLVAGSYIVIPAKAHHQLTCSAGSECILLTRRAGATDYHFDK